MMVAGGDTAKIAEILDKPVYSLKLSARIFAG
jgi:hypothetical protein